MREVHACWREPFRAYCHHGFTRAFGFNKSSTNGSRFFMHIGKHIKGVFCEQGRKVSWFAEKLCCDRRNVYKIFERESIDTALLSRISTILNHNFLQDLAEEQKENENK